MPGPNLTVRARHASRPSCPLRPQRGPCLRSLVTSFLSRRASYGASGFAFAGSDCTAAGATPAQRRMAAVAFAFSSAARPATLEPWLPPATV